MKYHGKLYGKLWDEYFNTSHTTDEWDAMGKRITELEEENKALRQHPVADSSILLEQDNDISIVGKCANCGVEFHIHKLIDEITYTENEVKILCSRAALVRFDNNKLLDQFDNWFNQNKKK